MGCRREPLLGMVEARDGLGGSGGWEGHPEVEVCRLGKDASHEKRRAQQDRVGVRSCRA